MSEATDARFMQLALRLGARMRGRVWPNPAVGCIIVRDGRILARGWTQPGGRPHAEVVALQRAGAAARGATAYVSLEPCAHHGRTPPCCDALAAAGIARVVTPMDDPDPRVQGRGHAALARAGIRVDTGVERALAADLHRGFLTRLRLGRPMVTLKLAASFDGRIATDSGESRWITGPEARRMVHALRLSHDAVMVGGGTARADDPMLTVRGMGAVPQPVRVVVSTDLDLPAAGAMAGSVAQAPLWLLHAPGCDPARVAAWQARGARCIAVAPGSDGAGRPDPAAMLAALGAAGLTRVLCEGGGQLAAALLGADLVDEVLGFGAGCVLGSDARPAVGPLGLVRLDQAPRFRLVEHRAVGPDVLHRWSRPVPPASA